MVQHIKNIIATFLGQKTDWRIILLRDWSIIMGDLANHVSLAKIDHDTLILHVQDSCWLHELYALSPLLLTTINKKLDQPHIKKLRFRQAGVHKKKREPNKNTLYITQRTHVLSLQEQTALASIQDPCLQQALKHFLYRCKREQQ